MLQFTYTCKKNGREYVITSDNAELANPQDQYAWRRGVREYMDNYHANVTLAGLVKGKTVTSWTTDTEFTDTVSVYCEEAVSRFHAGDVPGERQANDPQTIAVRKVVADVKKAGIDFTKINPEKLIAWLAKQDAAGRAA